ncbi:SufE-like protein 2 [Ranunculus cassubicifolius]
MAFSFTSSSFLTIFKPKINPNLPLPTKTLKSKENKLFFTTAKCKSNPKLQHIVHEFQCLPEPIDRVKRLLHYASLLPPGFSEQKRVSSNKVNGCTVEVWLDVTMDEFGRMRFSADSDSEIMKGFCSCLIWLLDGEFPEEVLKLKMEDLEVMNIGLYGRANSRVNTWNNVLVSMKKRTQLLANKDGLSSSLCLWK